MKKSTLLPACLTLPFMSYLPAHAQSRMLQACVKGNADTSFRVRNNARTEVIKDSGSYLNEHVQIAYASRGRSFCRMGNQERALADFTQARGLMHFVLSDGKLAG